MLTDPCNVQFAMFYFVVHLAYFLCVSCLQDFEYFEHKFNSMTDADTVLNFWRHHELVAL